PSYRQRIPTPTPSNVVSLIFCASGRSVLRMRSATKTPAGIISQRWWPRCKALRIRLSLVSRPGISAARTSIGPPQPQKGVSSSACSQWTEPRRAFSSMSTQSWWEKPPTPPPNDANLDFEKLDPDSISDASEELLTRRIHILGVGSIGTLVAHSLKLLP